MDLQLRDKVAVVSAASKGLGKASAAALAKEGEQVQTTGNKRSGERGAAAEAEVVGAIAQRYFQCRIIPQHECRACGSRFLSCK